MISCTEFIPLYSEFFKYLEKKGGHDAVVKYWYYISDYSIGDRSNPHSLASFIDKCGPFEGAIAYWNHTLTEEACDLVKVIDYNHRCVYTHMRHCPSRGMLNALEHVEPYYDYCSHCDLIYSRVLEKYGIVYKRDKSGIDHAECRDVLYEKDNPPSFDFTTVSDEELRAMCCVEIIDMKSEDNKYLHRDFHTALDNALRYCGDFFGHGEVVSFLCDYVKYFYAPLITDIKSKGLTALSSFIENMYKKEEASSLLHIDLQENTLTVTVDKCPAIEYMHSLGQEPSQYFIETTRTLYGKLASECGYSFSLEYYNEDGGARFIFKSEK
jgi:hypothetical protein